MHFQSGFKLDTTVILEIDSLTDTDSDAEALHSLTDALSRR